MDWAKLAQPRCRGSQRVAKPQCQVRQVDKGKLCLLPALFAFFSQTHPCAEIYKTKRGSYYCLFSKHSDSTEDYSPRTSTVLVLGVSG